MSTDGVKVPDDLPLEEAPPTIKDAEAEEEALYKRERKQTLHTIFIYGVQLSAILIGIVLIVRILHFITPLCWHWLDDSQLQTIDKFLFSGIIGALVGRNFDKIIQ